MGIDAVTFVSSNELSREGIRRQFSELGIPVSVADPDGVLVDELRPDSQLHVIVVEVHHAAEALELCLTLRQRHPASRIVILCEKLDDEVVVRGFQAGLNGFLTRSISFKVLTCKLALVCADEKVLPTELLTRLMSARVGSPFVCGGSTARAHAEMSERELGILRCLAEGSPNKVISRQLNIAEPTVKIHVKAILRKLQVANRTQAAVWAINHSNVLAESNA